MIRKTVSFILSSDPAAGALNVSADGSQFSVQLSPPLHLPRTAVGVEIGTVTASIWNTSPNISAAFGNNVFRYTTGQAPAGTYTIVIPDGLYSLDALGAYLSTQFVNQGHSATLFTLSGNGPTGQSIITFQLAADQVDFTVANSVAPILGFNQGTIVVAPSAGYNAYSPNVAAFNRVNSYLIATDLINGGIPVNNSAQGVIAGVPITAAPGSQFTYNPPIVVWAPAPELIGVSKGNFSVRLLDQSLRPTPTAGETYTVTVSIRYFISGETSSRTTAGR